MPLIGERDTDPAVITLAGGTPTISVTASPAPALFTMASNDAERILATIVLTMASEDAHCTMRPSGSLAMAAAIPALAFTRSVSPALFTMQAGREFLPPGGRLKLRHFLGF